MSWAGLAQEAPPPASPYTRIEDILKLDRGSLFRKPPARLRAVVTYSDLAWNQLFVADSTGGLALSRTNRTSAMPAPGAELEIIGHVEPGEFAPSVEVDSYSVIGVKDLPRARDMDLRHLVAGQEDSQFVRVGGVAQETGTLDGHSFILLSLPTGPVRAFLSLGEVPAPAAWEDAELEVEGVCGTSFTAKGQLISQTLFIPNVSRIRILRPAPTDPFASAAVQPSEILRYTPNGRPSHRVHVRGIVTVAREEGWSFLQCSTGNDGIRFIVHKGAKVQPGEWVDLAGFPAPASYGPYLKNALVKHDSVAVLPAPRRIQARDLAGDLDATRVQLEATLVRAWTDGALRILSLEVDDRSLRADVPTTAGPSGRRTNLRPGARLRLTGVLAFAGIEFNRGTEPRLHLAKPEDIEVISNGPWMSRDGSRRLLGFLALAIGGAVGWGLFLRRRLAHQDQVISSQDARLNELAANTESVFWLVETPPERVLYVSPAYERIWKSDPAHLKTSPRAWLQGVHPEDRALLNERLDAWISNPGAARFHAVYRVLLPSGDVRHIRDTRSAILEPAGGSWHVIGVATDITEESSATSRRQELESQLAQIQKLHALGTLASGVHHDLTNLLATLSGHLDLLAMELPRTSSHNRTLQAMRQTLARAHDLGSQVLSISRREEPKRTLVDLPTVTRDAVRMLRVKKPAGVKLVLKLDPATPRVQANGTQMLQIAVNLITNSFQAMKPGDGEIRITSFPEELQDLDASDPSNPLPPGSYAAWNFVDTGTGIPPEVCQRIFEPFFTTKGPAEGNGLGLAIVQSIITHLGGRILARSTVGEGTEFSILLPAAIVPPGHPASPPANEPSDASIGDLDSDSGENSGQSSPTQASLPGS